MRYSFDENVLTAIQDAFMSAKIVSESVELSAPMLRDYFFVEFIAQPSISFDDHEEDTLVDVILLGDKQLSEFCSNALSSMAKIELGFRWTGSIRDTKQIDILGFCIKVSYVHSKISLQRDVINRLCALLKEYHLIKDDHDLSKQFFPLVASRKFQNNYFFQLARIPIISGDILRQVASYIVQHISPKLPEYVRENESGINPVYQNSSAVRNRALCPNEKKIWLFRSDFILAVGNKNAYWASFAENGLPKSISPELHQYVNWDDRYGHPSLACGTAEYDRSVFYGGLLAQREGYLEVYTSSGRYYRNDLSDDHKKIMEAYLSYEFLQMYGAQTIVFVDAPSNKDYFECAIFYADRHLPNYCSRRVYDFRKIERIFREMDFVNLYNKIV